MNSVYSQEYLEVLRGKYTLVLTDHGIPLYQLLATLHNSEGADPDQASTSSDDSPCTMWDILLGEEVRCHAAGYVLQSS